ncbi:hypothetical protein PAP_07850 [Palaeococcus pacificus DY20341]|uniref:Cytochrome C biogenesis protein transmembrane domain-containing protein n=1 Tax=Palaeococcus pacificus DY20341 TaxID=1343739 RepID=A0A075LUB2_9EURY|nr:cytochrome c biogenesis protein CcdA [Palaeococcus pacificus]AIF69959.1 hypothetical protein PAP_07850 [Palaeococcus pacificus DY20341]
MKRIAPFIVLLLLSGFVFSLQEMKYGGITFNIASTQSELSEIIAANEGKYIFLYYYSPTCPACNYMKETTFKDPATIKLIEENLIPVAIDVNRGRDITSLRYILNTNVLVIQPDNVGYYTPKSRGEEVAVSVPGTPTMVIFKVENGKMVLKGLAVGALNSKSFDFFVRGSIGSEKADQSASREQSKEEESNLSLAVLLPIFSAGIVSVFSPCVLPLIVSGFTLIFAKRNLEVLIAGMVLSFSLLGALAGSLGAFTAQIRSLFYLIGGIGFISLGVVMINEKVNQRLRARLAFLQSLGENFAKKQGKFGDFLLGMALGTTWIGCIAPYVGFALLTAALSKGFVNGFVVMLVYSLGFGLTLYLLLSSKDLAEWINKKFLSNKISLGERNKAKWELALGAIMILIGLLMLTELTSIKLWSAIFESLA